MKYISTDSPFIQIILDKLKSDRCSAFEYREKAKDLLDQSCEKIPIKAHLINTVT